MDTSSSILSHILHVLARNPASQEKLRKEVSEARAEKGDMDFDQLNKLPFLDAICRESLRL
jgi:cytochrome P450